MAGGLLSRRPKCRLILICCATLIATLSSTALEAGGAHAAASPVAHARFGASGSAATPGAGAPHQLVGITDNCSHLNPYPAFGKVCVTGSSWAPASLVAADPLHLDVFSNGPTTKIVGPNKGFGPEWQCTELAVRWAAAAWGEGKYAAWQRAGWNGAAQTMWGVGPHLPKPLQQVPNGSSQAPQKGDLLIFHEPKGVAGPGHVAIVLSVNRSTGKLTFIGENQYKAPAVVQVPSPPGTMSPLPGLPTLPLQDGSHTATLPPAGPSSPRPTPLADQVTFFREFRAARPPTALPSAPTMPVLPGKHSRPFSSVRSPGLRANGGFSVGFGRAVGGTRSRSGRHWWWRRWAARPCCWGSRRSRSAGW
jgi:CHAP domain-containing protein